MSEAFETFKQHIQDASAGSVHIQLDSDVEILSLLDIISGCSIDLAGHEFVIRPNGSVKISNNADVTIRNGKILCESDSAPISVTDGSLLIGKDVKLSLKQHSIVVKDSSLTFKGAVVTSLTDPVAVAEGSSTIHVQSGSISSKSNCTFCIHDHSKFMMSGGSVETKSSDFSLVLLDDSTASLQGGKLKSNGSHCIHRNENATCSLEGSECICSESVVYEDVEKLNTDTSVESSDVSIESMPAAVDEPVADAPISVEPVHDESLQPETNDEIDTDCIIDRPVISSVLLKKPIRVYRGCNISQSFNLISGVIQVTDKQYLNEYTGACFRKIKYKLPGHGGQISAFVVESDLLAQGGVR